MRPHVGRPVQQSSGNRVAQTNSAAAVEGPGFFDSFDAGRPRTPARMTLRATCWPPVALAIAMLAALLVLR